MSIAGLIEKYGAKPAIVTDGDGAWVRSKARKVDVGNPFERALVNDLSAIMDNFIEEYGWAGASSNNIYWAKTESPLRVIKVLDPELEKHLTIVNPKLMSMHGGPMAFFEGCGSIPGIRFLVPRVPYVCIEGLLMKDEELTYAILEYGIKTQGSSIGKGLGVANSIDRLTAAAIVEHECDHLKGILLSDRSGRGYRLQKDEPLSRISDDEAKKFLDLDGDSFESSLVLGREIGLGNGYAFALKHTG